MVSYHLFIIFAKIYLYGLGKTYESWKALQPLSEKDEARLSRKFTVEFNFNSNHIEGNTLTYGQTELLLLFGKVVGETEMKDFEEMKASTIGINTSAIQKHLKSMTEKGYITRREKDRQWDVFIIPSV